MAAWLGDRGRQCWPKRVLQADSSGFEVFWDERGSIDHVVNGERRPEMSQLAGALAIIAGLAPTERWARLVETITDAERLVVRSWLSNGAGEQSMEKWQRQVREGRYDIDWDVERQIVLSQPFHQLCRPRRGGAGGPGQSPARAIPALVAIPGRRLQPDRRMLGLRHTRTAGAARPPATWSSTRSEFLPAEPGYAKARIAPRLGRLAWPRGAYLHHTD